MSGEISHRGKHSKLDFWYDDVADILEVEGIKFAGDFFRALSKNGFRIGAKIEIVDREPGVVTLRDLK